MAWCADHNSAVRRHRDIWTAWRQTNQGGMPMIDPNLLKDPSRYSLGRRDLLKGTAAGGAALAVSSPLFHAFAAETITVADPGGVWSPAADAAFVKPFEKETGISVNHIARQHYPSVEIKANVETKTYTWDVVIATDADVFELAPQNLLGPLDWSRFGGASSKTSASVAMTTSQV